MRLNVVEGWTGDLDFQLLADGNAQNISGNSIALIVQDHSGASVTFAGNISVPDATTGKVRFSPQPADLLAAKSPYNVRWKVTDGAGKVVFFPSGKDDFWTVRPP